ncbi:tRNA pseudouridine(55) synthase TruB [soil metagenome]
MIDKPAGLTSHDVVNRLRRLTGQRSVGHTGTLDPAATGVLPVALGSATKVISHIADTSKTYIAEITFGVQTDTYDIDGTITAIRDVGVLSATAISAALTQFIGPTVQRVPAYSAVQRDGVRLYSLARKGVEFELPEREIVIFSVDLLKWNSPTATICVDCGPGTYIRSLASDLGALLNTGAHLSNLVRIRSGGFTIEQAWTLKQLAQIELESQFASLAVHPDSPIQGNPAIIISRDEQRLWDHGNPTAIAQIKAGTLVRAYSEDGDWIGFGTVRGTSDAHFVQPVKVVNLLSNLGQSASAGTPAAHG